MKWNVKNSSSKCSHIYIYIIVYMKEKFRIENVVCDMMLECDLEHLPARVRGGCLPAYIKTRQIQLS